VASQITIRTQSGKWIDAPNSPGAFVMNGGQLLQRWTNDYFLATTQPLGR
jgi:isopenicillin N synthase-like dioxygenase